MLIEVLDMCLIPGLNLRSDKFNQGKKYSSLIDTHQAELRREEKITDQKVLSVSYSKTGYINLDSSSGCGKNSE